MVNIRGYEIPTSIRAFKDDVESYILPATNSLNWQGSDWEYPTALTFKQETLKSEQIRANQLLTAELAVHGIPPEYYVEIIDNLVKSIHDLFGTEAAGYVADTANVCLIKLHYDFQRDMYIFETTVKIWPRVSGVTVSTSYSQDTTI